MRGSMKKWVWPKKMVFHSGGCSKRLRFLVILSKWWTQRGLRRIKARLWQWSRKALRKMINSARLEGIKDVVLGWGRSFSKKPNLRMKARIVCIQAGPLSKQRPTEKLSESDFEVEDFCGDGLGREWDDDDDELGRDMLQTGLIVGGWDKYEGGKIYGIPLGGTIIEQPFAIGGSGSSYLYGFFDQAWKEGMTKDEAEQLVIKAVSLAIARDGASGGVVRTVTINSEGVTRNFYPGDKLPLWYEELEPQFSLLDIPSSSGPEPMNI
ncbi:Proteasome, subunit alpha/beta [Dillenia turbinata]|uniref:Proteasome, subunit alpha/beta n=1 Tax=Dillenia turbinata TaxID=194707 RepID=A0AAN8V3J6_9MAGN